MKIIHVYKLDCFQASRAVLQMKWVNCTTVLLHRAKQYGTTPFDGGRTIESQYLSQRNIRDTLINCKNEKVTWVFHGQSSLVYLIYFLFLKAIVKPRNFKVIYDVHDLNEAWDISPISASSIRARLRYIALKPMEWIACNIKSIKTITVSNGLAKTIAQQYGCQTPTVIRSAPEPTCQIDEILQHERIHNAFLFFGTTERVPFGILSQINKIGCELHLYGRGIDDAFIKEHVTNELRSCIRLFGPYSPDNLDFLKNYRCVLLFAPNDKTLNFKYSLPNKLFQGLSYGTKFLISENFEEIKELLDEIDGAKVIRSNDYMELKDALGSSRDDSEYLRKAYNLSINLANEAKKAFQHEVL